MSARKRGRHSDTRLAGRLEATVPGTYAALDRTTGSFWSSASLSVPPTPANAFAGALSRDLLSRSADSIASVSTAASRAQPTLPGVSYDDYLLGLMDYLNSPNPLYTMMPRPTITRD